MPFLVEERQMATHASTKIHRRSVKLRKRPAWPVKEKLVAVTE